MDVDFEKQQHEKLYQNFERLRRKFGERAETIIKRINELLAADSVHDIRQLPQTGFHGLGGEYKDCFAVYVKHPNRLIFRPLNGDTADLRTVTKISIIEICYDYH